MLDSLLYIPLSGFKGDDDTEGVGLMVAASKGHAEMQEQ